MPNLFWHDYLLIVSFFASIAGLYLLHEPKPSQSNNTEATERILFRMCFAYWMVYCLATSIQKLALPDWEILFINLKITAIFSYFITFSCVLCLPLHRISSRQVV